MAQVVRPGKTHSTRHRMLSAATAALRLAGFAGYAVAPDYPTKPVRLIVPFPPGGLTDIQTRLVAHKASHHLGHQVVVDHRPGAEGRIGVELIAKAPADGHTIGLGTIGTLLIAPFKITQGFEPTGGTPEAFAAHISAERIKWSRVVSASGLKFD